MKITEEYLAHLQMVTADFDTCTHEQLVVIARLARVGLLYLNSTVPKSSATLGTLGETAEQIKAEKP